MAIYGGNMCLFGDCNAGSNFRNHDMNQWVIQLCVRQRNEELCELKIIIDFVLSLLPTVNPSYIRSIRKHSHTWLQNPFPIVKYFIGSQPDKNLE